MATVPQKTLNWLWDVLRREYRDPQRTYSDLAQTLSLQPGLSPRTDVYTNENGVPALLVHLVGTIPVNFRGTIYRFPLEIWMPHTFPLDSPIFYVKPTDGMVVRPGQHVSPADGRIYHPYLARWRESTDRSSVGDFVRILSDVFSKEPPVMTKQQMPMPQPQHPLTASSVGLPQGPRLYPNNQNPVSGPGAPPPPPPKQPTNPSTSPTISSSNQQPARPNRYDAPPPLPSQVQIHTRQGSTGPPLPQSPTTGPYQPQRQSSLGQGYSSQTVSGRPPPQIIPQQSYDAHQGTYQYGRPITQNPQGPYSQPISRQPPQQSMPQPYRQGPQQTIAPPPQVRPQPPKPPQDLLDDSPFEISLPSTNPNLPTPAIPPNPQKAALLSSLSTTILQNLHNQIQQSASALPALQSQYSALNSTQQNLNHELSHLQHLHSQISQNVSSLNQTLQSADRTITSAKQEQSTNKIPAIDEIIMPPTVVSRQLYDAVSEQRGYEAAIWALTEGFVQGRIGSDAWDRKTRACAREEFMRKWLVRRIGRGMGLDEGATVA